MKHKARKLLPWLTGAGLAVGHITLSSNCTLPRNGQCSTCGSCVLALGVLVSWALLKKRSGNSVYLLEDKRVR